jgi:hypothetical protein
MRQQGFMPLLRTMLKHGTQAGRAGHNAGRDTDASAAIGPGFNCLTAAKVTRIKLLTKGYGYSRATSLALAFSGGGLRWRSWCSGNGYISP